MASYQEQGEKLGYKDEALRQYVADQQKYEREERAAQREERKIEMENEEKRRLAAEEKEKREFQLTQEKLRLEHELKIEQLRQKSREKSENEGRESMKGQLASGITPRLPTFMDTDDIGAYIERFERFATTQGWDKKSWAVSLGALLTGSALEVYSRLSSKDALDYDVVKSELYYHYNLTEDGFRTKFRNSEPKSEESSRQFLNRLGIYLDGWVEMAKATNFDKLKELILREQFIQVCPSELAVFLKEREFHSTSQMCMDSERFLEAHGIQLCQNNAYSNKYKDDTGKKSFSSSVKTQQQQDETYRSGKECFNCHKLGHTRSECRNKGGGNEQICTSCKLYGHTTDICRNKSVAASLQTKEKPQDSCYAVSCSDSYEERLGCVKARVGDRVVTALRDSGCSTICVDRKLVRDDQLTGETKVCKLADGSERKLKVALIDIDSPYLTRARVVAMCMDDPTFALIIGDVEGATCKCNPNPDWSLDKTTVVAAVTTRAQSIANETPSKPLAVKGIGAKWRIRG